MYYEIRWVIEADEEPTLDSFFELIQSYPAKTVGVNVYPKQIDYEDHKPVLKKIPQLAWRGGIRRTVDEMQGGSRAVMDVILDIVGNDPEIEFSVSDVNTRLGQSPHESTRLILSRFARKGFLFRVRLGVYKLGLNAFLTRKLS